MSTSIKGFNKVSKVARRSSAIAGSVAAGASAIPIAAAVSATNGMIAGARLGWQEANHDEISSILDTITGWFSEE